MDDFRRKKPEEVYSKKVRAGKKRTYFFDVKSTRNDDYYLIITESKKDFRYPNQYVKHKIFLYKEDFNKFINALTETIDHVKTELLPNFQFDMFDRDFDEDQGFDDLQNEEENTGFPDEEEELKNEE
jgi:hypothetical protein